MATFVPIKRKCGNGWQAVIRKQGHKPIKRTFDLKSDAQQWAAEQEVLIKAKKYKDPRLAELVSLDQALEKYRQEGFLEKKAPSTMAREVYSRRNLERLIGKNTPLSDIDSMIVNQYQNTRLTEEASASSIRQELAMLSRMFNKARKIWRVPVENPVNDVERVKPGRDRDRFLTTKEARLVLNEAKKAKNEKFYPFVLLLMHTGMRSGEAARLHTDFVNLQNRSIIIKQTKSGRPRNVPLTKQVAEALGSIKTNDYYFLKPTHLANANLMLHPGNAFRSCWKSLWQRLKKDGKSIPHFTPHDIRHTAASHLLIAGVDIRVIADILGHSTLQMAMRYTHTLDSHRQDVIDKISYLGE
jgi:integrase